MEIKSSQTFDLSSIDMDERTLSGYAATWDRDKHDDIIHRGAFSKSINEAFPKGKIKVLWQHDDRQPIGMPVEMIEDEKGLKVKAKISKTQLGDEALELMRDGVVDSLSIGFYTVTGKSNFDEAQGIRHLHELKLVEFSPVTFPANEAAVITAVKSLKDQILNAKLPKEQIIKSIEELKALVKAVEPSQDTQKLSEQQTKELIAQIESFKNIGR